jgi:hypothetical protein
LPTVKIPKLTLTSEITPGKAVLNLSYSKFEFRAAF